MRVFAHALAGVALLATPCFADEPPDGIHVWRHAPYGGWEYDFSGGPIPLNGRIEERRHEMLVQGGLGTAIAAYALSVIIAGTGDLVCAGGCDNHDYKFLYLPLVGPIAAAASGGVSRLSPDGGVQVVLAADAVLQTGGLIVGLIGHFWMEKVVVVGAASTPLNFALSVGARGAPAGVTFAITGW